MNSTAFGKISGATDLSASPDGKKIAFTGTIWHALEGTPSTRVCILDLGQKAVEIVTQGKGNDRSPQWSPDGRSLAFMSDRDEEGVNQLYLLSQIRLGEAIPAPKVNGSAEYFYWSPAGSKILVGVAGRQADAGDAEGSGKVGKTKDDCPKWMPVVEVGIPDDVWRTLWLFDIEAGTIQPVGSPGLGKSVRTNVWEANWCGSDKVVCIASAKPNEGAWYSSCIELTEITSRVTHILYRPVRQLANPVGSPSGKQVAVIEALGSDRGVMAGNILLIDISTNSAQRLNTNHVDVNCRAWPEEDSLFVVGFRGLETVAGMVDTINNKFEELWSTTESSGKFRPEATWLTGSTFAVVLESWTRYPEVAVVSRGSSSTITTFDHEGANWLRSRLGQVRAMKWNLTDNLEIQGLLFLPKRATPPYPLILNAHGGPIASWRDRWPGNSYVALLVSRGYAVLDVNPRGSSGRGQDFAELIVGDLGGGETRDFVSAIDALEAQGLVDPNRIGIIGASHGGFQASWIITQSDRFAASVPIAAVTDLHSMHFTSNISGDSFNAFVGGSPYSQGGGDFLNRSPVMFAGKYPTPVLQIAGQADLCVPVSQALEYHQACKDHGVESALIIYPGEGHGIRKFPAYIDMCVRIVSWFERFMPPDRDAHP